MTTHRCKPPPAAKYSAGNVFQCECGSVFVLTAKWVRKDVKGAVDDAK